MRKDRKTQSTEEIDTRMLTSDRVCKAWIGEMLDGAADEDAREKKQQGLYSMSDEAR